MARETPAPEPVLAVAEIQGNVLPGFDTRHQALLFFEIEDPVAAARALARLRITTLADVLLAKRGEGGAGGRVTFPWVNIAFSFEGLRKLFPDAERLTDAPLKQGMHRRSALLGDPTGEDAEDAEGDCRNWLIGRPGQDDLDVLLIVGADDQEALQTEVGRLCGGPPRGLRPVVQQCGGVLPAPRTGREPFGFCDNISQPGVRGRISETVFLTPRDKPHHRERGGPVQNLVWPGEFVFGYPGQDALDSGRPGPIAAGGPAWSENGSLLVFRRLRQDVSGFHAFLRQAAAELSLRHPALAGITPERLGAKLMGRWSSGTPLILAAEADRADLGDPRHNNDFGYLSDPADPDGLICPRSAHIRRSYPRDAATSGLTEAGIETHRLLRRSIPFGDPVRSPGGCGILFLAYQTSIERQFEFVTRAWLNNPHLHDTDDGHDPIAGQSFGAYGDRRRVFSIPVRSAAGAVDRVSLTIPKDWVVPTGGGYFFVPAVSALARLRPASPP